MRKPARWKMVLFIWGLWMIFGGAALVYSPDLRALRKNPPAKPSAAANPGTAAAIRVYAVGTILLGIGFCTIALWKRTNGPTPAPRDRP